ncbi:hypothetical protein NM449_15170 [Vibrio metschnikovii]|uniref:hypothetical protein n=1 Tax=Vibrio metschnikovii TaxID=28172 RepID=UPI00315D7DB0
MANSVVIQQLNNQLKVNSDAYDLSRIVGVEVKVLPFIAFLFGAFLGFVSSNKYEFRLEFNHLDETGIQWFTAAKSRKASDYVLFKEQEMELKRKIT